MEALIAALATTTLITLIQMKRASDETCQWYDQQIAQIDQSASRELPSLESLMQQSAKPTTGATKP